MASADAVGAAKADARERMVVQREGLAQARTRRFLVAQTTLLSIATALVLASVVLGLVSDLIFIQSILFCSAAGLLTGAGWYVFSRHGATHQLVTALLYVDVVVGMAFFYFGGEFETPSLSIILLPIIMAPLFTAKRHAYGLATVAVVLYLVLLISRYFDVLPYGHQLPAEALKDTTFLVDSAMGFTFVAFGAAVLAGQASFEIRTSQQELEAAVERQTELLTLANEQLQERNRALDQFNAELSHDLRSPLQTALANAELLRQSGPPLTAEQGRLAEAMIASVSRMGHLTRELLRLSRMEVAPEAFQRVPFGDLVSDARADLAHHLSEAHAVVEIGDHLPIARGSPGLLRELVQNLIENAVKYGRPDSPTLKIEPTTAPLGRIAVAFEDNGPGVPAEDRDRIFRPFVRLERDRGREGLGHGLAIANRIVTAHGGSIRVEDGPGLGGARFVVELPAG